MVNIPMGQFVKHVMQRVKIVPVQRTSCTSCNSGKLLDDTSCVDSCPDGKYSDGTAC